MAKFTDALKFWSKPLTRGVRAITGNLDEQEEGQLRQEQERLFQSILNTTQPFRMGANTFAQNYGPVFRALTGGDPLTPGPVEQFTREALTPDEQDYLERKPYMAALKSSVGMGSSLMPFASRAVPAATLGARTAQIAGRGLPEGLAGGFGYSREGKELQDTALGGVLGTAGELLGNYIMDPKYRGMVNNQLDEGIPGKYSAALGGTRDDYEPNIKFGTDSGEYVGISDIDTVKLVKEGKKPAYISGVYTDSSEGKEVIKYLKDNRVPFEILDAADGKKIIFAGKDEVSLKNLLRADLEGSNTDVGIALGYKPIPSDQEFSPKIFKDGFENIPTGPGMGSTRDQIMEQARLDAMFNEDMPKPKAGMVGGPLRGRRPRFAGFVDYNEEEPTETLIRMSQDRKRGVGEGSSGNDLRRQINELAKRILDKNGNLK